MTDRYCRAEEAREKIRVLRNTIYNRVAEAKQSCATLTDDRSIFLPECLAYIARLESLHISLAEELSRASNSSIAARLERDTCDYECRVAALAKELNL